MTKFKKNKKLFGLLALIIIVAYFGAGTNFANAQAQATQDKPQLGLLGCVENPVSCGIYVTTLVVSKIFSLLIALGAYLTRLALDFNEGIINAPAVQSGFGVALSIANLGFVLGIIIIAIATILRWQTYGIKQILWKLVIAAIVVNFSLVIAGTILDFSDSFTKSFIKPFEDNAGFVTSITSSFRPQALNKLPIDKNAPDPDCVKYGSMIKNEYDRFWFTVKCDWGAQIIEKAASLPSFASFNTVMAAILNLVFTIIFDFIIAFTFLALAILLLIRYVYIGFLLVLAPLAWLTWIFPNFSHLFKKWWDNFVRWAFFPPLVVFFLWLAAKTGSDQAYLGTGLKASIDASKDPLAAIAVATQNVNALTRAGEQIIILALAIGGLFAANSLSITGSKFFMGLAQSAGAGVAGYAGKLGKKAGRATYQKVGGEKLTERMQKSRIPGVSAIGRGVATLTERGGKGLVEADAKEASSKDSFRLSTELQGFMGNEKRLAYVSELQKRGDTGLITTVGGKKLNEFLADEKLFNNYKQQKLLMDTRDRSFYNLPAAQKELDEAKTSGDADRIKNAENKLNTVFRKGGVDAAAGFSMTDSEIGDAIAKGKPLTFGLEEKDYKKMRDSVTEGVGKAFSAQMYSNYLGKIADAGQLDEYANRAKTMSAGKKPEEVFSEAILNWMDNSPGAGNLGVTREKMGVKK